MASLSATLADALKADMDAQSWPTTLTIVREYLQTWDRADMGTEKRVNVFPVRLGASNITRGGIERTHGVAVVLRGAVDPGDAASVDLLVEVVEAFIDRYQQQNVGTGTAAGIELINADTLYDPDVLAEDRAFLGGIIITYTTRT